MSGRRKSVTFHVTGGGRNADGPVWYVWRRDALDDTVIAEAPTREKARAIARQHARRVQAMTIPLPVLDLDEAP